MDVNFLEVENVELRKEIQRLNKLVDELLNENKAYETVVRNWKEDSKIE